MPTEQDVKFSDYIDSLNQATDQGNTNIVAKEKTTGNVVKVDGKISNLTQTATEADLKAGNYLVLDGAEGTKRLPAELVAKAADSVVSNTSIETTLAGMTAVSTPMLAVLEGVEYEFDFSAWETSTITNDYYVLRIVSVDKDGSETLLREWKKPSSVPSSYDFIVPTGAKGVKLYARGDAGESLSASFVCVISKELNKIKNLDHKKNGHSRFTLEGGNLVVAKSELYIVDAGIACSVELSKDNWSVSNIGSTYYVLRIVSVDKDGNETELKRWLQSGFASIPSSYDFIAPTDSVGIVVYSRADEGSYLVVDIDGHIAQAIESVNIRINDLYDGKFSEFFEMGAITFAADNSWTYINSSVRARTGNGYLISLKAGDKITLNGSGWKYHLGCKKADGTYWKSGWKTADFVLTEDGEYAMMIATSPTEGEQTSLEQMIGAFNIVSKDGNGFFRNSDVLKKLKSDCEKLEYNDIVLSFVGAGQTTQTSDFVVKAGERYSVTLSNNDWSDSEVTATYAKFALRKKTGTTYTNIVSRPKGSIVDKVYYFDAGEGEETFNILYRGDSGERLDVTIERVTAREVATFEHYGYIESMAHRGYSAVCPENTAIAYIEAFKHGFKCVEMDIRLTADNQFVCIHNDTIDQTSDGSGRVSEMTVDQLKTYDFGSYKGAQYAGQRIMTFEEFIQLCVRVGIHPYIDIKSGYAYLGTVADIIRQYQMEDNVSFMSYDAPNLAKMSEYFPKARLCLNMDSVTQQQIDALLACKTGQNKCVVNAVISGLTEEGIELVKNAKLPLQVSITDNLEYIRNLNPYITGVISKRWVAGKILCEQTINDA